MFRYLPAVLSCLCAGALAGETPDALPRASPDRLRESVTFLASDAMEGRGLGSAGLAAAADEIERRFAAASLAPVPGLEGYSQAFQVDLQTARPDAPVAARNIVGLLQGTGPNADEFVVVGAHYDHVGRGLRPQADNPPIHNGADDNASGTAALVELAGLFSGRPQPRSILFVAFSAEEVGLVGSGFFTERPPVPLAKIALMINLDMVGRVRKNRLYATGQVTSPSLESAIRRADDESPLEIRSTLVGGLGPSDHLSFAKAGVPVLFLHSGVHADYHRPTDDADLIAYPQLAEVVDLTGSLIRAFAAGDRPVFAAPPGGVEALERMPGVGEAMLGIVPTAFGDDAPAGVAEVVPESGAAVAGIRPGDTIVSIDGRPVDSPAELIRQVAPMTVGQEVQVGVLRNGETRILPVRLSRRAEP